MSRLRTHTGAHTTTRHATTARTGTIARISLVIIHISVAAVIVSLLYASYSKRNAEYLSVESSATKARMDMEETQQQVNIQRALLNGLQDNDPYVIEKIAREKYGYSGYNELAPPKR